MAASTQQRSPIVVHMHVSPEAQEYTLPRIPSTNTRRETMRMYQVPMLKHVWPARASTFAVLAALLLTVWTLACTAEAGSVNLEVFAPKDGTLAGVEGKG